MKLDLVIIASDRTHQPQNRAMLTDCTSAYAVAYGARRAIRETVPRW